MSRIENMEVFNVWFISFLRCERIVFEKDIFTLSILPCNRMLLKLVHYNLHIHSSNSLQELLFDLKIIFNKIHVSDI